MIRLAIQKKGRLTEGTLNLLRRGGIEFDINGQGLVTACKNFPMELLHLRDEDIPEATNLGFANAGVVGENVLNEIEIGHGQSITKRVLKLPFAECRLSIAVSKSMRIENISELDGKKIATSYPNILSDFSKKNNLKIEIVNLAGSVELASRLQMSDAIFDIVSSGETLRSNDLREFYNVDSVSPLLIASKKMDSSMASLFDELLLRFQSAIKSQSSRYILMNAPKSALDNIIKLLPSLDAPTIMELCTDLNKVAIHTVVPQSSIWELIRKLKLTGASGIIVLPIEAEVY